ncbi:MAG: helix-turn-helix transcriptional regulator [Flavobacteriaceae bacterium]|nr:helix-turn-helix transcriptional regulator [Flavobacteriaceae bacterium]
MNNIISKNIRKHREIRGISQEYMASALDISQSSYAKIENNSTKITVDRLFSISRFLEMDVAELLDLKSQTIYNQKFSENSIGHQTVKNLYQENKEVFKELLKSKDEQIALLKEMLSKK